MTIVPFSAARFTPFDLSVFNEIAEPKITRGLWATVKRNTGKGFDRLLVMFPGISKPVFSFERDKFGNYQLWYHDRAGTHIIGEGETAADCLAVWKSRGRMKQAIA